MGTSSDFRPSRLADVLFGPVQQRVLGLLFGQPERSFQSAELIRLAQSGTGAAHRLLLRFEQSGLVSVSRVGNQKFYQANAHSPVFAELCALVRKLAGWVVPLKDALEPMRDRIVAAFVFGSLARGTERAASDIDLMVVSDGVEYADLYAALAIVEPALSRRIEPHLLGLAEWHERLAQPDGFVARVATQPRTFVIGSDDDLR